jgi:Trypsin-like peptidase domain
MPKRFQTAAYVVVFLAFCGYLGWKAIVASGPLPNTTEYQDRLKITAANIPAPVDTTSRDDALRVYAVNVTHTAPFKKPFVGYGIYLGHGAIITAAHVVGHWPFFTNTRVLIAGQDLPAKVIKEGTVAVIDLALLSVDETRLPISLRLRRNPLCEGPIRVGTNVAVVIPQEATRSRVVSPQLISPKLRARFNTLINEAENSGSGVFDVEKRCLLGIISRKVMKLGYKEVKGRMVIQPMGYAGYFVAAARIARFIPPDFHF